VLPGWFLDESKCYKIDNRPALRESMVQYVDNEAVYLTLPQELVDCVSEVDEAYRLRVENSHFFEKMTWHN